MSTGDLRIGIAALLLLGVSGCIFRGTDPKYRLRDGNPFDEAIIETYSRGLGQPEAALSRLVKLIDADRRTASVEQMLVGHGSVCRREQAVLQCTYDKDVPLYGPFGEIVRTTANEFALRLDLSDGAVRRIRVCHLKFVMNPQDDRSASRPSPSPAPCSDHTFN